MTSGPRILIAGAGAVGSVMAALLVRHGHACSVVCRGAHLDAVRARGIELRSPRALSRCHLPPPRTPPNSGHTISWCLPPKAYSLAQLTAAVAPVLRPKRSWYLCRTVCPGVFFGLAGGSVRSRPSIPAASCGAISDPSACGRHRLLRRRVVATGIVQCERQPSVSLLTAERRSWGCAGAAGRSAEQERILDRTTGTSGRCLEELQINIGSGRSAPSAARR